MRYVRRTGNEDHEKRIKPLLSFIRFFVWILGILFILDNLGFKISTVVAGLGIGGIAIALAAQAILGDLFSYFVIYFDRPFELGDFIIFDEILGSVEYIGVKTTKLRSLGGEQIVISNSALTNSRIRNYKRMERRRIVFSFGVLYETPVEIVRGIPALISEIITSLEAVQFDRAHFKGFGDSSLDFEVVYYVLSPDYLVYMDIQQSINFRIMEELAKRNVDFAYPTRTVYLKK
jgi:small-conductance mechanosensitive channel